MILKFQRFQRFQIIRRKKTCDRFLIVRSPFDVGRFFGGRFFDLFGQHFFDLFRRTFTFNFLDVLHFRFDNFLDVLSLLNVLNFLNVDLLDLLVLGPDDLLGLAYSRIDSIFNLLKLYLKKYYVYRNFTGITNVLKSSVQDWNPNCSLENWVTNLVKFKETSTQTIEKFPG
jgi:hypothetical protein